MINETPDFQAARRKTEGNSWPLSILYNRFKIYWLVIIDLFQSCPCFFILYLTNFIPFYRD